MIIKEFCGEDTCGKQRLFVEVSCEICKSVFTRQKRQLKQHTCSATCNNILKGSSVLLQCDHCSADFIVGKSKLNKSKSGKHFCSRKCKDTAQTYMIEIQPDHYGSGTGIFSYREKAFKYYKPICSVCGFTNILALEVHHLDKNRSNNEVSNLEILCANCHSIKHALLA